MRKLSTLYSIVLEENKKFPLGSGNKFICNSIHYCEEEGLISLAEKEKLFAHFYSQRPTGRLHKKFIKHGFCVGCSVTGAWWHLCGNTPDLEEGVKIREEFLTKMIKITNR